MIRRVILDRAGYSGNGHPAAFPRELVRRCLLLGSRPEDMVLDPFGGSGTTGAVAQELGRDALLIELNPEYVEMSQERVCKIPPRQNRTAFSC